MRDNDSTFAMGLDEPQAVLADGSILDRPWIVVREDQDTCIAVQAKYAIRRCLNGEPMAYCVSGGEAVRAFLLFRQTRGCPPCEIVDLETGRICMLEGDVE